MNWLLLLSLFSFSALAQTSREDCLETNKYLGAQGEAMCADQKLLEVQRIMGRSLVYACLTARKSAGITNWADRCNSIQELKLYNEFPLEMAACFREHKDSSRCRTLSGLEPYRKDCEEPVMYSNLLTKFLFASQPD